MLLIFYIDFLYTLRLCFLMSHPSIYLLHTVLVASVSVQFHLVTQLCLTLFDLMDCSMQGFAVHHQLPELTQTHVH